MNDSLFTQNGNRSFITDSFQRINIMLKEGGKPTLYSSCIVSLSGRRSDSGRTT